MPYCFTDHLYPGVPLLSLHEVKPHETFTLGDLDIVPVVVMHGRLPILGYRIGKLVYITDMKTMALGELDYLQGVDTLVVNALRLNREHHAHQLLDDAVAFARKVGARRTYLIHCTHQIGLYERTNALLPEDIRLAYDGLTLEI